METRAFETADQAAGSAAAKLADGERLSRLWRYVFVQVLDGYTSVLGHRLPGREAWPWWFVTDLSGLHPRALVESPSSFRRRGVFITDEALDRAHVPGSSGRTSARSWTTCPRSGRPAAPGPN